MVLGCGEHDALAWRWVALKAVPAFIPSSAEAHFNQNSERQDENGQLAGKHEEEQSASDNSM